MLIIQEIKEKITIKKIVIWVTLIVLAILCTVSFIKSARISAFNRQLRNIATDKIEESYTNVYADVVSMVPEYTVEESKYKNGHPIGQSQKTQVICKCKTVEGTTVWIEMFYWKYPGLDPIYGFSSHYYDEPVRFIGYMTTFEEAIDNAPYELKKTLILVVR